MTLKFVLAPDSFKDSASAKAICEAMEKGIRRVFPKSTVVHAPMADGGEGSVEAVVEATAGTYLQKVVQGPLKEKVEATFGLHGDGETAVIEMAAASGLELLSKEERNPLYTTSYGTGELIRYCLNQGLKKIILCIGGSATNDGGVGMAQALGIQFKDKDVQEIPHGGKYLTDIDQIDVSEAHPNLSACEIVIASDVDNPLTGPEGASEVFGPQKGATREMVKTLDEGLVHLNKLMERDLEKSVGEIPGAGAAGGLGAGLLAFTNAEMRRGVDVLIEATGLKEQLKEADVVFTGEGQMDFQTKYGKTPMGVAQAAKEVNENIKVIAISGSIGENIESLYELGFDGIFGTVPGPAELDEILENTLENVTRVTEAVCRVLR